MINETVLKLMQSFNGSFINEYGELIVHDRANEYFNISKCETELDVKCKVLEWFSRGAYKTESFRQAKKNDEFHDFMRNGINQFLGTDFSKEDMARIYQALGNQVNRELTIDFINSKYDVAILEPNQGRSEIGE